jgi:hypothetical protein
MLTDIHGKNGWLDEWMDGLMDGCLMTTNTINTKMKLQGKILSRALGKFKLKCCGGVD